MTSSSSMSPSKNSISSWLRLRKKSDSINDNTTIDTSPGSVPNTSCTINDGTSSNTSKKTGNSNGISTNSFNQTQNQRFQKEDDARHSTNASQPLSEVAHTSQSTSILHAPTPIKTQSRRSSNPLSINIMSPQRSSTPQHTQNQQLSSSPTPSRPFLGFKSKSSHSFRPLSQFLDSTSNFSLGQQQQNQGQNLNDHSSSPSSSNEKLRSHRDSFLQQRQLDMIGDSPIFGCDIETSTKNASGKIYISSVFSSNAKKQNDSDDLSVEYGKAPLVIIQCGSYLKHKGLDVEGIFRLAGSNKRIKELQIIFSSPPNYGSKINWEGYTVHDAASLLRRYLSSLSEPLIPLRFYDEFRNRLIEKPECIQYLKIMDNQESIKLFKSDKEKYTKCVQQRRRLMKEYAILIQQLPPIQKRVLFYLLDLLAQFNLHSSKNRMPAKNLAAIFQPSVLFHPAHDMNPDEYAINSLVIESMITYSHKILAQFHNSNLNDVTKNNEIPFGDLGEKNNDITSNKLEDSSRTNNNVSLNDINQILEEDNEFDVKVNDSDSNILSKPILLIEKSDDSSVKYSKNYNLSPLRGSPLKNLISPAPQVVIDDSDTPKTLFSSPKPNRSRPYSKSFSQTPHTEIVRISAPVKLFAMKNDSPGSEDNLSRILSNQSAMSSLLSSKMSHDNKDSVDNAIGVESGLAKELGLASPTVDINNNSMENISADFSLNSQNNPLNRIKDNIVSQTIINNNPKVDKYYELPPVTPTAESMALREKTPDAEIINMQPDNKNGYMDDHRSSYVTAPQKDDQRNDQNDSQKADRNNVQCDNCSFSERQSTTATSTTSNSITESNPRKSSASLAFSFQPSLLQGHLSNQNSQSSVINDVSAKGENNSLNDQISNKTETSKKSKHSFDQELVSSSRPNITNDPSLYLKTAITPTSVSFNASDENDEVDQINVKKRSNKNNSANKDQPEIRSPSLFTFSSSHRISLNLTRNETNSSELSQKSSIESPDKSKEKRNWFDKLKPRSTPKR